MVVKTKKKFDFKLIDEFFGYNSATDKTKLSPGFMIRGSKNVYKKISGTIASRPGLKRRGSADDTSAGIKSSYEWSTSVGTFRALRVCNNKLQVESDIAATGTYVWYDLLETSTLNSPAETYTRFVFDTWFDSDEKRDRLVMVRGDDKILHWSGAMALVASATVDTITKQGDDSWAEVGFKLTTTVSGEKKIIIDGREFTYTGGEDTTTLTGVTASSGTVNSLTSGMVAIQSVMVGDNVPIDTFKADFIKIIGNQAWVGSYSSKIVWVSADITVSGTLGFLNYTNTGSLVLGDPDAIFLDSLCKGIGTKDGKVIIFGGDSDMYVITPNDSLSLSMAGTTSLTTSGGSATRYIIQKIEKKQLAGLTAALGHEFIGNLGEYIVWLDQKNRLRALGTFANVDSIKPITLSLPVQNELTEDDFTGGHLRVISDNDGDTVYLTAPNNGRDWMYQIREKLNDDGSVSTERIWQPPQIRGIQRFAVIDGIIYGHSNVNPQIYQIWNTGQWFDDNPTDEPIPYICSARFAYNQHGVRDAMITFDMIFFEGYMTEGVDLNANLYFDYQGASALLNVNINNNADQAKFYTGVVAPSIGDASFGENPLGDGILPESDDQELLPKFRSITDVSKRNCFEYSIEIYSIEPDSRWEILAFGTNARLANQEPIHLRK